MSSIYYKNQKYTGPTLDLGSGSLTTDNKTIVGAINELDAEVGAIKKPVVISQTMSVNVSAGNTAVYTGLSVTVPARCIYAFRCILGYRSAMPKETWIGVSNSNNPETYSYQNSAHNDGNSVSLCGYAPDAQTFYIWGKWANTDSDSYATVRGWYQEV